jgi:hypothetical protein
MAYEYVRNSDGHFVCPYCQVVKKNQSTMHMHYKANHDGPLKHKCKDCDYETSTKQGLDNHTLSKHPPQGQQRKKEFACKHHECAFLSATQAGLRSHFFLRHLSSEVEKYLGRTRTGDILCTCCGSGFSSKPSFVYHLAKCLPNDITSKEDVRHAIG